MLTLIFTTKSNKTRTLFYIASSKIPEGVRIPCSSLMDIFLRNSYKLLLSTTVSLTTYTRLLRIGSLPKVLWHFFSSLYVTYESPVQTRNSSEIEPHSCPGTCVNNHPLATTARIYGDTSATTLAFNFFLINKYTYIIYTRIPITRRYKLSRVLQFASNISTFIAKATI